MFLPRRRPSQIIQRLRRSKCVRYRLPTQSLLPIGEVVEHRPRHFDVQVVSDGWGDETAEAIERFSPKSPSDLTTLIERAKANYEKNIAPETLRDRIDSVYLSGEDELFRDGVPVSLWDHRPELRNRRVENYDRVGLSGFLCLEHVYIDPTIGRFCMLFQTEIDSYFDEHGFGIHLSDDGGVECVVADIFLDVLAEHARFY